MFEFVSTNREHVTTMFPDTLTNCVTLREQKMKLSKIATSNSVLFRLFCKFGTECITPSCFFPCKQGQFVTASLNKPVCFHV